MQTTFNYYITVVYPDGKVENTAVLKEDIESARKLIKISDIDKSYYGDRSELKFEKDVMILIENQQKSVTPSTTNPNQYGFGSHHRMKPSSKIQRLKILITKKELKHRGIPLF